MVGALSGHSPRNQGPAMTDMPHVDEQGRLIRDWHISPQDSLYSTLQIKRKRHSQSTR